MKNYKDIFDRIEATLRQQSWFSDSEFENQYGHFKNFENKMRNDIEYFEMLVLIIFYSGFRASTVESKENIILRHLSDYTKVALYSEMDLQHILSDTEMIKNERKIISCINNAKVFRHIINEFGSFQNYLDSFDVNSSFDNLILLKEELEYRFEYLGGVTVYHFLTDLGFNVLKPDRVILRIFKRLGLIENEKQLLKAVVVGRQIAKDTGFPIRYIDIILVKYGQLGQSQKFGINNGICFEKNPKCVVCKLTNYCNNFQNN